MSQSSRRILPAVLLASSVAAPLHALAQERYPSRATTLVMPFPAGGQTDVVGRVIGEQLAKRLGQPVLVENRPGVNGALASEQVARKPPGGYTLVVTGPGTHAINQLVNANVKYDARKDFTHGAMLTRTSNVLLASPAYKVSRVAQVIARSKAQPKSVNFALTGIGASGHMSMELLKQAAGGGQVNLLFVNTTAAVPCIQSGQLRALAAAYQGSAPIVFGHLGDGKLHFNLSAPEDADIAEWQWQTDAVNKIIHDGVARMRGSISADHGVRQLKRHELELYKPAFEPEAMRAIKNPLGIMSPGKLLPTA